MYALCRAFFFFSISGFALLPVDSWANGYSAFPAIPYLTVPQTFAGRRLNFPNPPIYAATVALDSVSKFNDYRMGYLYAQPTKDEGGITEPPSQQCTLQSDNQVQGTCIPRTDLSLCAGGIANPSPDCSANTEVCCVQDPGDAGQLSTTKGNDSKRKRQFKDTDVGIRNHGVHPKFLKDKER